MRNYLTFAGRDSRDFGVYISGQGTFSAPQKAYAFYNVPGRNGAILGNDHSLENIEVSYECFIYKDFSKNIADFRTFLLSRDGYQKLTDSYHTDEYRSAVYVGAFEPEVTSKNDAGSFMLTFSCKPQRWLISGDSVYSWTDNIVIGEEVEVYAPQIKDGAAIVHFGTWEDVPPNLRATTSILFYVNGVIRKGVEFNGELVMSGSIFWADGYASVTRMVLSPEYTWTGEYSGGSLICFSTSDAASQINKIYMCLKDGNNFKVISATSRAEMLTKMASESYAIGIFGSELFVKDAGYSGTVAGYTAAFSTAKVYVQLKNAKIYTFASYVIDQDDYVNLKANFYGSTVEVELITSDEMSNPTLFPSQPMIRAYGDGSFEMDGITITITNTTSYTDIDCELMDCYEGSTNRNNDVTFSSYDFPKLLPGQNEIRIISGITTLEITPRWWRV